MKIFSERLRELREDKKLTIRDMAKFLQITHQSYLYYEKHGGEPRYEMLVKLARFFNVSTDYLLGVTDS